MSQSILYYPTININNDEWLKSAVFYWDEVCSIVPYVGYPDISDDILYLQDREVYRAIYPQDMLESDYASEFIKTVVKRMRPFFGALNEKSDRLVHIRREKIYNPSLYTLVHYKKFPSKLYELLVESGNLSTNHEAGWVEMDTRFANIYMKTLAEYAALYDEKDVIISSDKVAGIVAIYPRSWRNVNTLVLELTLHQCLPVPAENVSYEDLLNFKERRADDLYELRKKIRDLEFAISHSESSAEVKARIVGFVEDWNHELNNADRMFRGDRVNYRLKGMTSFIGATVESYGFLQLMEELGMFRMPHHMLGTAVGMSGLVALSASNRNYKKKIKSEQSDKGFAYLIKAREEHLLRNITMI